MIQSSAKISQQYEVGPDISEQLFDNILKGEVFQAWKLKDNAWPLYIVGGPGSGKSTLASTVAQKLKGCDRFRPNAVVTIFVREQMQWDDNVRFLILLNVLHQLSEQSVKPIAVDGVIRQSQNRTSDAVPDSESSLIHAIKESLQTFDNGFLILDCIDRLGPVPGESDDHVWKQFQDLGFKVMLTSRTLAFDEEEFLGTSCDACYRGPLQVYWRCESGMHKAVDDDCVGNDDEENCEEEEAADCGNGLCCDDDLDVDQQVGTYILCQDCYKSSDVCPDPECQASDSFIQPYTRRRIDMNEAVAGTLSKFVARELETEHGNLGLDSGATNVPSLSQFGSALLNSRRSRPAQWLRNHIAGLADHNVALARLRVDIVHENMETIQEAEALPGGLPHALAVLFEAEIQGVLRQSQIDADLGIKALALWATGAETEQYLLEQLMEVGHVEESLCTIERVLHTTRGLLMIAKLEDRPVLAYTYTFATYIKGGYCGVVDDIIAELGVVST
ncbi:hypothetical protein PFICI_15036 [Pestalotiopsis fici W106-1]|uniref:Nephrocystin 3-like N-terminal domain-containing protein n=1 Tax=Pestalotiopsis fici (strain W106-1 / CGMCC3.15140) TaxID=1229662 RepID=W3WKT3_PESFW|nr:uncharacterized protein PFICI_15036 [Pestalotiopsis fici W106-1]ETS73431.1 hypothetical protein PFICI_15036 [Pestalotiopsis fici W106-1]